MFNLKTLQLSILLSALVFLGASCPNTGRSQAGVYRSEDFGTTWLASNTIDPQFTPSLLSRESIFDLQMDTKVSSRLYAATGAQGLFVSENNGDLWSPITTSGQIQAFSIADTDNSILIAARLHQLYLSTDQGKIWKLVYTNPNGSLITDVLIDPLDKNIIYASVITGELLKTVDLGNSWSAVHHFKEIISKIVLAKNSRQRIYVVLPEEGVYRSLDNGVNWSEITESIQRPIDEFTNPLIYRNLIVHQGNPDDMLVHTSQGLYTSTSSPPVWKQLELLTASDKKQIRAIAWDPLNRGNIYYATPTVFYQSKNFGQTWTTIPFLAAFPTSIILPDNYASGKVYIGTKQE